MSPVYGAGISCIGLLIFFLMLSVIRRPGAPSWLKSRLVREATVFGSMVLLIGGLGLIASHIMAEEATVVGFAGMFSIAALVALTALIIWKTYRPIPVEELPAPVLGFDSSNLGPKWPAPVSPSGRKVA